MSKIYYVLILSALLSMLLLSSCVVGSSLLFMESETTDKPNMVYNPSFEMIPLQEKRMPTGWLLIDSTRDLEEPIECDSTQAKDGKYSLRIEKSNKYQIIVSDAFPINCQSGYFVKASARSTAEIGPKIKFRFISYNNAGVIRNKFSTNIRTTQEWKQSNISAGFLKFDAIFGRVLLLIPPTKGETIWIDGIGCYRVHFFPID